MFRKSVTTLGIVLMAAVAYAQDPLKPMPWWNIGSGYRTSSGYSAIVKGVIKHLHTDREQFIVKIVELPPPGKRTQDWQHGQEFTVDPNEPLGLWLPAFICHTALRGYISRDGYTMTWESDVYVSMEPCPIVPIK